MTEELEDLPRRLATLRDGTLAATTIPRTDFPLSRVGEVIGAFDAYQNELAGHLRQSSPEHFSEIWWELEVTYALQLEGAPGLPIEEFRREVREKVDSLRLIVESTKFSGDSGVSA